MMLFDRLSGSQGLERIVAILSDRIEADPAFDSYFVGVDKEELRGHRAHYLAAVLGGPEAYQGRGMREADRPHGIDDALFGRFMGHVADSAHAAGIPSGAADELAGFLRGLRPVIVSSAPEPSAPPRREE